jgi:hypothetical protein
VYVTGRALSILSMDGSVLVFGKKVLDDVTRVVIMDEEEIVEGVGLTPWTYQRYLRSVTYA